MIRRRASANERRPGGPGPDDGAASFLIFHALPSALGTEAPVTGKLSFSAPTRIDGVLRGEIRADDLLVVGEGGSISGTIHAPRLLVLGEVTGTVRGAARIEVGPRGRLRAAVETEALIVHEGGIFDGRCRRR